MEILAAIAGALAAAGASYGLSKLGGSPSAPKYPGQMSKFGGTRPEAPFTMPSQGPAPLQFGQQQRSGIDPYNMPALDAATQKALSRYMGR
jgi:hypothetical protein